MIKSMTGFGRGELVTQDFRITVEMKAVNHRYCDISIKLPKKLNGLEAMIRGLLKQAVDRGKIDVYISYEDLTQQAVSIRLNESMAREYYEAVSGLSQMLGIANDVTAVKIARMPEVVTLEEIPKDAEDIAEKMREAVAQALGQFAASREKEGADLREDILGKLAKMKENVSEIEKRYPAMLNEYKTSLEEKIKDILGDAGIDEGRIAAEVVIYADKICVDEETVRLRSHMDHMADELRQGGSIGRKLDFIAQEMNREANTILSKANDIEISDLAIELKTEIEKIREQVQNIE